MNKDHSLTRAPLTSPCIRNCCLDKDDICLGCGRHLNDILAWRDATCEEQQAMLELARKRLVKKQD
jgi:uncharacterized protein